MASSKVQVSGSLKFSFSVIPKDRRRDLEETAVVRIKAPELIKKRASIDLVAVLNVSHQLTASVLGHLKKAMKFVIAQLEKGDCLSIVAFDNSSSSYTTESINITSKGRKSAEKKVDDIVAGAHTGSKSGVAHAVEFLNNRSDKTSQGFVMLVSDGLDNSKSESFSEWKANDPSTSDLRRYPVHTMGLGTAHDPKELHLIARDTKGTYSCIAEELNDSKIMEAFAVCLAGLKSVVAVNTEIKITKGQSSSAKDVKLTALFDSEQKDRKELNIDLGVLYAGEVKDWIFGVSFTVPAKTGWGDDDRPIDDLLAATVSYHDVLQSDMSKPKTTAQCKLVVQFYGGQHVKSRTSELTPFPMVLPQMARMKVLKFFTDKFEKEVKLIKKSARPRGLPATAATDKVKFDEPMLQRILANSLDTMWGNDKNTEDGYDSICNDARKIGVDTMLRHIDDDIEAIFSCLYEGRASELGCVYSWLLTYEAQRAAYTGLPGATTFLTPAMKKMVQEAQKKAAVAPEEGAVPSSSATVAGSPHQLAPPANHLVDALEPYVKSALEKLLGGAGAVPSPNDAAGRGKPGGGGGGEAAQGNKTNKKAAEASKTSPDTHPAP
ncbi:hypothetical protein BS78_K290400 [Paspalum vaginatum]|uniref:VWFA domain-containing protein n=1 Tax=Paspalum vaginatum TaxID=158149 RepID=A0A9W8CEU6_9POAL|nr:hypothetical protein BS78_K290400 [Paspalum vaginatum]